jgi:hypothetical protein
VSRAERAEVDERDATARSLHVASMRWRWRVRRSAITMLLTEMRLSRALYLLTLLTQASLAACSIGIVLVEGTALNDGHGGAGAESWASPVWVWVMLFAGHQLLCLQLTVWRRKATLKQASCGPGPAQHTP